jgi:hypothetical protein
MSHNPNKHTDIRLKEINLENKQFITVLVRTICMIVSPLPPPRDQSTDS